MPYTFLSKRVKKTPQNGYWTSLIVLLLCIIIYGSLISPCVFKIIKQRHKIGSMRTVNWTILTTTEAGSRSPLFFDSDGTAFVVDDAANTSVCNDSHLFIGYLINYTVTLHTATGN